MNLALSNVISIILSSMSFILSIAIWIRALYQERRNLTVILDVKVRFTHTAKGTDSVITANPFIFENKSRRPIAITQIILHYDNKKVVRAELTPQYVGHTFLTRSKLHEKYYERVIESAKFPIELAENGAAIEYIFFAVPISYGANIRAIEILTNFGNLMLDEDFVKNYKAFLQTGFNSPVSSDYILSATRE